MPQTPDRFPGRREEEEVLFVPGSTVPSENGSIAYVTGQGFRFYENGILKSLSTGNPVSCSGGYVDNCTTTWMTVGAITITWSWQVAWVFRAHVSAPAGFSAEVRLYDQTVPGEVAGSLLTTSAVIPTAVVSSALAAPGVGVRTYLVHLRVASGTPTANHRASCFFADVIVT